MEYDYYCFKELCPQVLAGESNGLGQRRSAIYFVAPLRWGCSSVVVFPVCCEQPPCRIQCGVRPVSPSRPRKQMSLANKGMAPAAWKSVPLFEKAEVACCNFRQLHRKSSQNQATSQKRDLSARAPTYTFPVC